MVMLVFVEVDFEFSGCGGSVGPTKMKRLCILGSVKSSEGQRIAGSLRDAQKRLS